MVGAGGNENGSLRMEGNGGGTGVDWFFYLFLWFV